MQTPALYFGICGIYGVWSSDIMSVANGNTEDNVSMRVSEGLCAYCVNYYVTAKRDEEK